MPRTSSKKKKVDLEAAYAARRRRLLKAIPGEAALFASSAVAKASRDLDFIYRANTDLFYLTGVSEPETALLLLGSSKGPRSILYLRDRNPEEERWQGARLGLKRARRQVKVDEVRHIRDFERDLPELLSGASVLHYAAGSNPDADDLVWTLLRTNVGPRLNFPNVLKDARLLTSEMRMVKDRDEVRTIRHAVDLTVQAFLNLLPDLKKASSEAHAARILEAHFSKLGASQPAFPTIVASGRNATSLHHEPTFHPLWKKELILIDAGAMFRGYCADITRVFPASGKFSPAQAAVYDVVAKAVAAGVRKSRRDSTLREVHQAVVEAITEGLVELRILKGNVDALVASGKYRPYFMHRASHWLGLDVHDVATAISRKTNLPENSHERPLVPGNVFTLEPGLYLDLHDTTVPKAYRGIGVRLEEDILITETGAEVLSARLPIERKDVEALFSN